MPIFRMYVTETWENIVEVTAESEEQARQFVQAGFDTWAEGLEDCDNRVLEAFCVEREVTDVEEELPSPPPAIQVWNAAMSDAQAVLDSLSDEEIAKAMEDNDNAKV